MMEYLGIFLYVVSVYAALLVVLHWYEPRLIYYPNYPTRKVTRTPAVLGMTFEDVWLTTADGVQIHGWYLPTPDATYTLLFCHGNAGNISHWLEKAQFLKSLGFSVFLFDYRGYGKSNGATNEAGTYRDAEAVYQYLTDKRQLAASQIILYGESLGSGVVVELATRLPAAGLILEAAYTSIVAAGQRTYWFLPVFLLVRNRYESLKKISAVRIPLLILHSREDQLFPYHFAERLYSAAQPPKTLVEMHGRHNGGIMTNQNVAAHALQKFAASLDTTPRA